MVDPLRVGSSATGVTAALVLDGGGGNNSATRGDHDSEGDQLSDGAGTHASDGYCCAVVTSLQRAIPPSTISSAVQCVHRVGANSNITNNEVC
ncbi:MAG TPA: hypothetical protein VHU84_07335 [Lacipirellulaceae bacterium]|nr:hypothetical protein [Lacipirellulaceae bacterium]